MASDGADDEYPRAENIKVVVRIRPMQKHEITAGDAPCIRASVDLNEVHIKSEKNSDTVDNFTCSRCFTKETSQEGFFRDCDIVSLLDSALAGYRSCAFAFGQTGAGKTYTMLGPPDNPTDGLLGRCLNYIFKRSKERNVMPTVKISCLEVYHEHVYDLFSKETRVEASTFGSNKAQNQSLQIREHSDYGYYTEGCHIVTCPTYEDAKTAVENAMKNRQIGGHDLNSRSNRSHCITDIYIDSPESEQSRQQQAVKGLIEDGKRSKSFNGKFELQADSSAVSSETNSQSFLLCGRMTLVDLAGSERLKTTNSTGTKMINEAGFINKSLYVLGKVITGLGKNKMREGAQTNSIANINPRDVPFRESKLTKLLLGGILGGLCMMICCVSEGTKSVHESKRTLMFGMSCARIKNRPTKLLDPQIRLILDLKEEVQRLKQENIRLREASKDGSGPSFLTSRPASADASALLPNTSNQKYSSQGGAVSGGGGSNSGNSGNSNNNRAPNTHSGGGLHSEDVIRYSQSTKELSTKAESALGKKQVQSGSKSRYAGNGILKLPIVPHKEPKRNIVQDNKRGVDPLLVPPKGNDMVSEKGFPLIPLKLSKQYSVDAVDGDGGDAGTTNNDRDARDSFESNESGDTGTVISHSSKKARRSNLTDSRLSLLNRQLQKIENMEKRRLIIDNNIIEALVVNNMIVKKASPVKASARVHVSSENDLNDLKDDASHTTTGTSAPHFSSLAKAGALKKKEKKQQTLDAIATAEKNNNQMLAQSPFIQHIINKDSSKPKKKDPPKKSSDKLKRINTEKAAKKLELLLKNMQEEVTKAKIKMEDDPAYATAENEEVVAAMEEAISDVSAEVTEVKANANSVSKGKLQSKGGGDGGDDNDCYYGAEAFDNEYDDDNDFVEDDARGAAIEKDKAEKETGKDFAKGSNSDVVNNNSNIISKLTHTNGGDDVYHRDSDDDDDVHNDFFRKQLLTKYGKDSLKDDKQRQQQQRRHQSNSSDSGGDRGGDKVHVGLQANALSAGGAGVSADMGVAVAQPIIIRKPNSKVAGANTLVSKPRDHAKDSSPVHSTSTGIEELDSENKKKAEIEAEMKRKAEKEAENKKKVTLEEEEGGGGYENDDDFYDNNDFDTEESDDKNAKEIDAENKKKAEIEAAMKRKAELEAEQKKKEESEVERKRLAELEAARDADNKRKAEREARELLLEVEKKRKAEIEEAENKRRAELPEAENKQQLADMEVEKKRKTELEDAEKKRIEELEVLKSKSLMPTQSFVKRQEKVAAFLNGYDDDDEYDFVTPSTVKSSPMKEHNNVAASAPLGAMDADGDADDYYGDDFDLDD